MHLVYRKQRNRRNRSVEFGARQLGCPKFVSHRRTVRGEGEGGGLVAWPFNRQKYFTEREVRVEPRTATNGKKSQFPPHSLCIVARVTHKEKGGIIEKRCEEKDENSKSFPWYKSSYSISYFQREDDVLDLRAGTLIKRKKIKLCSYIRKFRGIGCGVIYDWRPPHIWWKYLCIPRILGSPSSYMT